MSMHEVPPHTRPSCIDSPHGTLAILPFPSERELIEEEIAELISRTSVVVLTAYLPVLRGLADPPDEALTRRGTR